MAESRTSADKDGFSQQSSTGTKVRLGVFGSPGSFSEEAGLAYAEREGLDVTCQNHLAMDEVLRAVNDDRIDLGVLPVGNSIGGLVRAAFEAMGQLPFEPVGQISMLIRHSLLVRSSDVRPADLTAIASHPQALAQCDAFLKKHFAKCERTSWGDTASAAHALANGELDASTGVLASTRAAEQAGLFVLEESVQDDSNNRTTFLVVRGRKA